MKQEGYQKFANEDNTIEIFCHNSTPLGVIHDFFLEIKGHIVDRMVRAQKEETETSEKHKELDDAPKECDVPKECGAE